MKVGTLLHPERGIDFVFEEARQADNQGYDSIWLGDHLMSGRGRSPQEAVWKFESSVQYFSFFVEKILSIKLRIRNAA